MALFAYVYLFKDVCVCVFVVPMMMVLFGAHRRGNWNVDDLILIECQSADDLILI